MIGETGGLTTIREAHAPMAYDFPTEQTYCPSSDVPTDACHTCIVLADADARLAAVEALAESGAEVYRQHHAAAVAAPVGDPLRKVHGALGDLCNAALRPVPDDPELGPCPDRHGWWHRHADGTVWTHPLGERVECDGVHAAEPNPDDPA